MPVPILMSRKDLYMEPIEVARKLAGFGKAKEACAAYQLALAAIPEPDPDEKMEAAMYVLQFGGEYRSAYLAFLELNHDGYYVDDTRNIMTEAFYLPNEKLLRSHYERNCKQLAKYEYIFRKDFLPFEELPVKFYPFDDDIFIPYTVKEQRFGDRTDYNEPVVSQNFFKNLNDPILAENVFSQYELEYLNDCVRPSEYVSRDNHIYLHYKDWAEFCSYLQVLNFRKLLIDKKFVFLIGDEITEYPIDFQKRFGIDYSAFPLKPVGIREINRLIWHMQLSYHNGGDFFNEIFDYHPNIISSSSVMNDSMEDILDDIRDTLNDARSVREVIEVFSNGEWDNLEMIQELYYMRDRTDKDILVAMFCRKKQFVAGLDASARIAPIIFYQPHFGYIHTKVMGNEKGQASILSEQYEAIKKSSVFKNFKYIKSFAPIRRITTSYGGSVKFMKLRSGKKEDGGTLRVGNEVAERVLFRGYLVDPDERVFKDCAMARFEDGKLNPRATFTALAAFLDVPYTENMKVCTYMGVPTDKILLQPIHGFDTTAVYKTYDDYANDAERYFLEYFLRDAYEYYGYDFKYYDGQSVDEAKMVDLVEHFDMLNGMIRETVYPILEEQVQDKRREREENGEDLSRARTVEEETKDLLEQYMDYEKKRTITIGKALLKGLSFVNDKGRPMRFMPKLELDPALLEQPLYH